MMGGEAHSDPDSLQPTKGPVAFGKYQLFATLGRGGMADVFLAVARGPMGFNKLAVLKRLRGPLAEEQTFLNMFLDEARLAARLNHPNVVHTYEVGEHQGQYFIAMEYLEGQSLNKIIKRLVESNDAVDHPTVARIVSDALAGLHHAHELKDYDGTPLQIVHRDVSPHNVFVTYEGQVKLVDFGIAKALLSQTQTEVGVLKGKVAYMAPEQAMGIGIDRRADLFAMGIVLWEFLTKRRLMQADSAASTLHRLLNTPIPRVSTVVQIDQGLDDIVAKALQKEPADRYQTAQEFREALEAWIASQGRVVRQEDIGKRVSTLFASTREEVKRQIQSHMAVVSHAATTGELQALNAESLARLGAKPTPSGHQLLNLGSASGSGSGVVVAEPGAVASASLPPPDKGRRSMAPLLVLLALVLGVGVAIVIFQLVRSKSGEAVATRDPVASSSTRAASELSAPTDLATTTATATATTAPTVTASDAPTASESPTTSATHAKKPPWWAHVDAGLPPAPATTTAPTSTTTEPNSTPPPDTGPGFLTLDTVPWTRVSEGGRMLGTTPIIGIPLSPGAHTFFLENPGENIRTSFSVNIKSGEKVGRRLVLKH